ncbi:hypothetical protein EON81_08880 [bacterium]|nr:MAG: hypothetical protein EON81_08880 [bacterium]
MAQIYEVFADTKLGDGTSWLESMELDGNDRNDLAAVEREKDKDRPWQELADDPEWSPELGWGGWAFLDDKAFCFYLPAAMVRCLRECHDAGVGYWITCGSPTHSLLNLGQHQCLRRWAQLMLAVSAFTSTDEVALWIEILESDFLEGKLVSNVIAEKLGLGWRLMPQEAWSSSRTDVA